MPRVYKKTKRAQQEEETRNRIVEATIALHQEIGGIETTISAIAERAGVERATIYRHFPDEKRLLEGCTGHYLTLHPPPEPALWVALSDRWERLRVALTQIYAYHRQTEVMMARAAIDVPQMPVLAEVLSPMFAFWESVGNLLAEPWAGEENSHVLRGAIGHAIAFQSWQSLARGQGLRDEEAVELMVGMICAAVRNAPCQEQ